MAQISSYFKCKLCNEVLKFPSDVSIVEFTISFLQFYRDHDRCESIMLKLKDQKINETSVKLPEIEEKLKPKEGE